MSADVIIDAEAHPDAAPWYGLRRAEPIGGGHSISIGSTYALPRYSLDSILDTIIARVSGGADLIIVGHGRETGLSARLFQSSRDQRFRSEIANALATDRATRSGDIPLPAISVARAAELCMITEAQVTDLRAKMNLVRAKRIGHVAFRACLMGAWPDTLDPYLQFFGCRSVSALDIRDTFGHFTVLRVEPRFDDWVAAHRRRSWHCYVYGETPDRVALATRGGESDEHSYTIEVAAESQSGFRDWRQANLTEGGLSRNARELIYYHGCIYRNPLGNMTKRVMFVGDPDYDSHVVSRP
jgi:hypothetical protein